MTTVVVNLNGEIETHKFADYAEAYYYTEGRFFAGVRSMQYSSCVETSVNDERYWATDGDCYLAITISED